jgi:hypothetical protein
MSLRRCYVVLCAGSCRIILFRNKLHFWRHPLSATWCISQSIPEVFRIFPLYLEHSPTYLAQFPSSMAHFRHNWGAHLKYIISECGQPMDWMVKWWMVEFIHRIKPFIHSIFEILVKTHIRPYYVNFHLKSCPVIWANTSHRNLSLRNPA